MDDAATGPAWREATGRLTRGIERAIDSRKLILAAVGILLVHGGWVALGVVFRDPAGPTIAALPRLGDVPTPFGPAGVVGAIIEAATRIADPYRALVGPARLLFGIGLGWRVTLYGALAMGWAVVVWSLIGGAIARIAVVQSAEAGTVGIMTALKFAIRKAVPLAGPPLSAGAGAGAFALIGGAIGLVYQVPGGTIVGGALAGVSMVLGIVMALILLGLAAGWPLMVATVAAEGEDGFDALSRAYSYVYQRTTFYAACVAFAWVVGAVGLAFVGLFARTVIGLAAWGVALGAPDAAVAEGFGGAGTGLGGALHGSWIGAVGLLAYAWIYSYFWTAAAQIYLILRREVDGAEPHDVYRPGEEAEPFAPEPSPDSAALATEPAAEKVVG